MKRKYLITLSLVIGFSILGIGGYFLTKPKTPTKEVVFETSGEIDDFIANETIQTDEKGSLSPYTGLVLSEDESMQDAFLAIIENSRQARPQSGLSQSDFVYEVMTEGGITRFMALFNTNYAQKIGPIRSARYYFLDLSKEFDLPFAHCGGSHDALKTIESDSSLKSVNEMASGNYFSRDSARVAPHNLYTSTENIEKYLDVKPFSKTNMRKLTFNDDFWTNKDLENCLSVDLKLSNYYSTSYKYSESGYVKSMDGVESIDASTNEPLTFDNIVIQLTNIKNRETEEYMDIDLVGSGDAIVISNGQYIKGTWSKKDSSLATTIKDANGESIPLGSGNTIWHIADSKNEIKIY
ncbi:DUF3048 domain-containing protein [uncultured Clostridium sp.]|jgi:hypothetical protein|uniref:DUF3048 domain-containing protein n=1 Tax=uncultured Clostridium sp. TaxID=59620 RepID=UPI0026230357|nr:DUF3048 domain-containing protein [uncultured Clostridium sp.]